MLHEIASGDLRTEKTMALLTVESVSKRFGGLLALDDVSLSVERGEIVGVIGPNGAGKTTLFAVISGFLRPETGKIFFGSKRTDQLLPHQVCKLGLVRTFQLEQTFESLTVFDTVLVASLSRNSMRLARLKAGETLESVGLLQKAQMLAGRLTPQDRKMLEVARALACEPQLILLDEVMAGLTYSETQGIVTLIRGLRDKGITFVVVEHVMKITMNLCTRIVVLSSGKKIAEGTPTEIATNRLVIVSYLGEGGLA